MTLETFEPSKELKDFVSHFWIAKWSEPSKAVHSSYYTTANSITEIVFAYKANRIDSEFLFSGVQGQSSHSGQYSTSDFHDLVGVSIYSHSIPLFFALPCSELNNKFATLEGLLGNEGRWLNERMATALNHTNRINMLSDFLSFKLRKGKVDLKKMEKAAQRIRQLNGNINIEKLSNDFCYSQKQFNRLFNEFVGFNPKLFARIVRFENTLRYYKNYDSLTAIAHANGYHDQSHFIRDFKSFSGYCPSQFFKIAGY